MGTEDLQTRLKWDKGAKIRKIPEEGATEDRFKLYTQFPAVLIISGRDFVEQVVRYSDPERGMYVVMKRSVESPDYPPTSKFVRATTIFQGTVIRATGPNSCQVVIVAATDLGSSLPKKAIIATARNQPGKWFKGVIKAANKLAKG